MTQTLNEVLEASLEASEDHLDDGASTWSARNLLQALQETEEGREFLQQEVYSDSTGIYVLDEQGYQQSPPIYRFVQD